MTSSVCTSMIGRKKYIYVLCILAFVIVKDVLSTKSSRGRTLNRLLNPIVLVPGDGGSQFEAKLNKPKVVHVWCSQKTTDWFPLWLNLELLAPYILDCFVDNIKLQYDATARVTYNQPGVETRQPGFGNTTSVEWLDSSQFGPTSYFYHIVDFLVKTPSLNYTRNKNIRGAPYDFRKAPNEMGAFVANLTWLVEDTYKTNNNTPVVLLGHSMGNMYILYWLQKQSQRWKDQYIKSYISLAGPWGGAVKPLRLMLSGDNLGVFVVNPLTARPQQRSMPSTAWLMPYDTFWNDSEVLVFSPAANYTVKDYARLFKDISYPTGMMMREDTEKLVKDLPPPGVTVHCLHGSGVKTPAAFSYTHKSWYDGQPDVIAGDGDGTVNMRSLQGCLRWLGKQRAPVLHGEFSGAASEHLAMLYNKDVMQYIAKKVLLSPDV